MLLEIKTLPGEEDSPRQLVLYDSTGNLLDRIPLFGKVQRTGRKRISINHTPNGFFQRTTIGFLSIDYVELPHRSRGGGNYGSFLVDSLHYKTHTGRLDVQVKKPAVQFVIQPSQLLLRDYEFTEADTISLLLRDICFEFDYAGNKYFTVTTRVYEKTKGDPTNEYFNHTYAYYYKNNEVLNNFHNEILKEFHPGS